MPTTRFTIAIPTHDRRETVLLAARSALAQTRPPEQVIVLCDGCTDGTADALRALGDERVEALELPKGPGYAYGHRNRSLELARGDAILWLADDDLLLPDHLEQIGALWDTGAYDVVQSAGAIVHPDDRLDWFGTDWSVPHHRTVLLEQRNTNPMASVSLRVEVARDAGGWDPDLPRAAGWDLWRRVFARAPRSVLAEEPTVLHFRATGRVQAWPDRVRQNADWLARLGDPARLAALRPALRHARAEREAASDAELQELRRLLEQAYAELAHVHREFARIHDELVASHDARAELHERLGTEQSHTAAWQERASTAETHATELRAALARIEHGGLWRLRARLLPLLRAFGRAR